MDDATTSLKNRPVNDTTVTRTETDSSARRYPSYKDSGVEWLGEIPQHWNRPKLAFLIRDSNAGEVIDKSHWGEGDQTLYSCKRTPIISSYSDFPESRRCRGDELLLTRNGTPYVHLPERGAIYTNVVQRVEIADKLDRGFAWFALGQAAGTLRGFGDIIASFNLSTWKGLRIPLPPLPEQRAIAAFLDRETEKIDALIEKKQRLIERLEEKRTALISHTVTKGLDPDAEMKDSGVEWLGEIPKHWETGKLKFISPRQSVGLVINPSSYFSPKGQVPFILGNNITKREIRTKDAPRITEASNQKLRNSMLRAGDLVTVRVGEPGVTAVVPPELDKSNCGSVLIIRRSHSFISEWLAYTINSKVGKTQIELVEYGAAQRQFNLGHAVNFVFAIPSKAEQKKIVDFLNCETGRIDTLIEKVRNGISRLQEYRTALISAAVTGEIDVRDAVSPSEVNA